MRDHPAHDIPMMGGTWGAKLDRKTIRTKFSKAFSDLSFSNLFNASQTEKGHDQEALKKFVWQVLEVKVQKDRKTERLKDRMTERQKKRKTERLKDRKDRETERQQVRKDRKIERQRNRETEKQRDRKTERQKD
jgi:hypothetical protein